MSGQGTFPLGPLGVIHGGPQCPKCAAPMPAGQALCPTCGADRGLEGAPYPNRRAERFQWVAAQRIDSTAKLVLFALACHDGPNSKGIFPSHQALAYETGLTARGIRKALTRLKDAGWLSWEQHWKRGQMTNRYTIWQAEGRAMAEPGSAFMAERGSYGTPKTLNTKSLVLRKGL